ncbi:glutaminase [Streptomyces sp. NPDC088748]|uniref:glutaminase n=1 Tax=Streptomyces sp. NPDC088748 TaxID=3365887 RepID=UPI0038301BA4
MDHLNLFEQITRAVGPLLGGGHVADYIPALAGVDLTRFGFAVADLTARVHGTGDWRVPFSIQSLSALFTLAMVLKCSSLGSGTGRGIPPHDSDPARPQHPTSGNTKP